MVDFSFLGEKDNILQMKMKKSSIPVEIFQQLLIEMQFFSKSAHNEFLTVDLEDGNKHPVPTPLEVNPQWSDKTLIHF